MKYKEAASLYLTSGDPPRKFLSYLYRKEFRERVELRAHGKEVTIRDSDLVLSVEKEMNPWIRAIASRIDFTEDMDTFVRWERAVSLAEYHIIETKAKSQMDIMRIAYQKGIRPIEVLTPEGLEAIGDMMVGQIVADVRKIVEKEPIKREGQGGTDCNI